MVLFDDIMNYQSGIYEYTFGELVTGHALVIVGWGHSPEDGSLFWICQNQWSSGWGEEGYVNIKAGNADIDNWAISCMPELSIFEK